MKPQVTIVLYRNCKFFVIFKVKEQSQMSLDTCFDVT